MRWLATVLAAGLAVAGCGSSEGSTADPFAVARDLLAKTAYTPSYQRCVIREAERMIPPAKVEDVVQLPRSQQLEVASEVMSPATLKCKEAGGPILDSHATSMELAPIKDLSARLMATGATEAGATADQARCIEQRFLAMPDAEFIELGNSASTQAQTEQAKQIVDPCLG